MSDPSAALQKAIFNRLSDDAAVVAVLGDVKRIFDRVPGPNQAKPYLTIFDVQTVEDGSDCRGGSEAFLDLHIWSDEYGSVEAKKLVSLIRSSLHEAQLDLGANHSLIEIQFQDSRTFRDPDGITTHAVLTFRALTEDA